MELIRTVMDIEASALNKGYPIEVGIAFTWQDGTITSDSRLIRYDPWLEEGHWCEEAERIHKITKQVLYEGGRPPEEVSCWLNESLRGRTVYVDSDKDKGWLSHLFDVAVAPILFSVRHVSEAIENADYVNEVCLVDFTTGPLSGTDHHRAGPDAVRISRALAACCVVTAP